MSIPSSTTRWVGELEVLDLTGVELTEAVERVRCVGEKIQPGDWIAADCDGAIVDAIVDPVAVDLETIGHPSSMLCHLGNAAWRAGRSLKFDPDTYTFTGDADANQYLTRAEYRKPWLLPKISEL